MTMSRGLLMLVALGSGCAVSPHPDGGTDAGIYDAPGRYAVGSRHTTIHSRDGGRSLPVELWYPASDGAQAEAEAGFPIEQFEEGARRTQLAAWVEQAPAACTPRRAHSLRDAVPAAETELWPVLLMSHCTEGFRFSLHSLAERLASHGFVVAAPDHVDNTRFEATAPLTNAFLAVRADDVSSVLDKLLDPDAGEVPELLRGRLDAKRVGVIGHSFGAVTASKVVEQDARVRGGFLIAAPADSPFLNSGSLKSITKPLTYLLALEDNSISYVGNDFIRDNFAKGPKPTWLIEVREAGHWTFSDIAGLGGSYLAGCGEGTRDPDGGAFTYLDNDLGRRIAQRSVTAWAAQLLRDDASAAAALSVAEPSDTVQVRRR
jgi:dienelactone hydrolase